MGSSNGVYSQADEGICAVFSAARCFGSIIWWKPLFRENVGSNKQKSKCVLGCCQKGKSITVGMEEKKAKIPLLNVNIH
jgi:hypothetical protein